jgi:hypothetical protein
MIGAGEYPLGGELLTNAIIEACLSEMEVLLNEVPGVHTAAYAAALAQAIQDDDDSITPNTLGFPAGYFHSHARPDAGCIVGADVYIDGDLM